MGNWTFRATRGEKTNFCLQNSGFKRRETKCLPVLLKRTLNKFVQPSLQKGREEEVVNINRYILYENSSLFRLGRALSMFNVNVPLCVLPSVEPLGIRGCIFNEGEGCGRWLGGVE